VLTHTANTGIETHSRTQLALERSLPSTRRD
jgi:hypothetical protein